VCDLETSWMRTNLATGWGGGCRAQKNTKFYQKSPNVKFFFLFNQSQILSKKITQYSLLMNLDVQTSSNSHYHTPIILLLKKEQSPKYLRISYQQIKTGTSQSSVEHKWWSINKQANKQIYKPKITLISEYQNTYMFRLSNIAIFREYQYLKTHITQSGIAAICCDKLVHT
jgi:hypothetical protein